MDKERLRQTLISLSILKDMVIPQRNLEIKNFLKDENEKIQIFKNRSKKKYKKLS